MRTDWESVLTRVMRKGKDYRFMEIVRLLAKASNMEDGEVQGIVSWAVLGNRSKKYKRVARGTYQRIA
jgi:hypothetical protein